ncbi:putative ribonuclease H-like domain-containing protein [Tanacetum coccineum]
MPTEMELTLEKTQQGVSHEVSYDESNTYVLERFNTSAGNPVKKILLKLNLSDHRLCKMVVECQSVKVKEFQERCNVKAFQEWYEHVGPEVASPQDGKVTSWRRDYAWLMISRCSRSLCQIQVQGTSSNQEVNDHNNIFTRESQEYELKTRDKAYINHASYCLVITDDCTRFCWVFFLASKDETSGILQTFIRQIENQLSHSVKIIRSDNGTEFKNRDMLEFCGNKGIKQEYSNARTPQQNGVAERMNRTLIEAARTMLADSLSPTTTFWVKHTLSVLGKFDRKSDEGFLVGYSLNSKAFRRIKLTMQLSRFLKKKINQGQLFQLQSQRRLGHVPQTERGFLTNPKIQAFRRELEEIALKHLGNRPLVKAHARRTVINSKLQSSMGYVDLPHGLKCFSVMDIFDERFNGLQQLLVLFDPDHPNKVYKVVKALYGLHQAPRAWEGILYIQDKYVAEILKKFDLCEWETAITPMGDQLPLTKDGSF